MVNARGAGLASIITGATLLLFLVLFGVMGAAGLSQQDSADPAKVAAFAGREPVLFALLPLNGVVVHLAAFVVIVALSLAMFGTRPLLAVWGGALGTFWVCADLTQNLMQYGAYLGYGRIEPATAIGAVAHGLQDAGHLGGGLWVLTLAIAAPFGTRHRVVSYVTAAAFALHPFIEPMLPAWFYLEFATVPFWFIWTGVAILARRGVPLSVTPGVAMA